MIEEDLDEDIYYFLGNYIYHIIQPDISGDREMFKYVLGKIYLEYFSSIEPVRIDF